MNRRQQKKLIGQKRAYVQTVRLLGDKQRAIQLADVQNFDAYAATPNGSARLVAFHDAAIDADDTLEAVDRAIRAGDIEEARKLIALGRESLAERIAELKELL